MLTHERLLSLLSYDQHTGHFHWLKSQGGGSPKPGERAGTIGARGYIKVRIDQQHYRAHRLAWFHVHGSWPVGFIDHINGTRTDNRIENLRDVSRSVNMQNRRTPTSGSATGLLGVTPYGGKFRAQIAAAGKKIALGYFDTAEEAHAVYVSAKRKLHIGNTL